MTTETFGVPDIKHPYSDYRLSDAINLAKQCAPFHQGVRCPTSLIEAREIIKTEVQCATHNWITGAVAMDVLDAAIDGKDLEKENRLL